MRLNLIVFVLYILFPVHTFGQYTFEKILNTSEIAVGSSVTQCHDGGFAISGTILDSGSDNLLVRTNARGEVLWSYKYSIQGVEHSMFVRETKDRGFILSGWSTLKLGMTLIKIDSNGLQDWSATYSKDNRVARHGTSILEVENGYILIGNFDESQSTRTFAVRINLQGTVVWSKILYNENRNESLTSILTLDSNVLVVGKSISDSTGSDVLLWKLDVNGNVQWVYNYDMDQVAADEFGISAVEKDDGTYHVLGSYHSTGAVEKMIYLVVDQNGNVQDVKGIMDGTSSNAVTILGNKANRSYILGQSFQDNALLYAVDGKGNQIWSRKFTHGDQNGFSTTGSKPIEQTSDGGFIITGWNKQGRQFGSISLIKTDSVGYTDCSSTGFTLTPWNIQIAKLSYAFSDSDQVIQGPYGHSIVAANISDSVLCFSEPIINAEFEFEEVCDGDSVQFINKSSGSISSSYLWRFGDGDSSTVENPVHQYKSAGNYQVTLLAYNALVKDSIKTTVSVHPKPSIAMTNDSLIVCEDEDFKLTYTASGGATYQWYNESSKSQIGIGSSIALPAINENYKLRVISDKSCISDTLFAVQALRAPEVPIKLSYLEASCYPLELEINSISFEGPILDSLRINFGDGKTVSNPALPLRHIFDHHSDSSYPVQYNVTAVAYYNNGCQSEMQHSIDVCEKLYIPNVFTPNGDGKNDVFELKGLDESNCEISIFDRFGILVYESNSYQNDWNGRDKKGNALNPDVYYFILNCDETSHTAWVKIMP